VAQCGTDVRMPVRTATDAAEALLSDQRTESHLVRRRRLQLLGLWCEYLHIDLSIGQLPQVAGGWQRWRESSSSQMATSTAVGC
jgi:hypothetical protein